MKCFKTTNSSLFFSSVKDITDEIWSELNIQNVYLSPKYLSSIEENNPHLKFSYVVLVNSVDKPIAFAVFKTVDFYLESVQNSMQKFVEHIRCFGRKFGIISPEKPFKILTCGNIFVSGEHGIFIKPNQDKNIVFKKLTAAISFFVDKNESLNKEISAFMIKDFVNESLFYTDELKKAGYNPFSVEPNMLMYIDTKWNSFNDYLAVLKTKFRVKAKKAISLSADLSEKEITPKNIDDFMPEMIFLYKKVVSNSSFNLADFNLQSFKSLQQNLENDYLIKGYFLNDRLVGFLSAIINQNQLDAHYVGIDYKLNRKYAIYQRVLYDYIKIAIAKKCSQINFGRTASEIKSSVGAVPQDLTIYLRHKQHIPNKILSLFLHRIQPTPFRQNAPFKSFQN